MKICVIGAGVVGCATAYQLSRDGHEVTLVEQGGQPATGTSLANGAQLSYSYVEPLASPATIKGLPGMLGDADSPLRFTLRWDLHQWLWGLRFLAACRAGQTRRGTLALQELAALSRARLEHWLQEDGLDIGLNRNGKLVLCPDAATFERQGRLLRLQAAAGPVQELLGRDECLAREPALAGYGGFVGGVWTASECCADPRRYCFALTQAAQRRGLRVLFGTRALHFVVERNAVAALQTSGGEVAADAYVLATGIDARELAAPLGERLPIYPVKGYSLTLALRPGRRAPATSVTDLGRKTVLAPLDGQLRVAAMAELVGMDLSIPERRTQQIVQTVEAVYPGLCDFSVLNAWAGLRPATPDSLPIVRPSRVGRLFLNLGHGGLGFTLAAGCAAQLAALVRAAPRPA